MLEVRSCYSMGMPPVALILAYRSLWFLAYRTQRSGVWQADMMEYNFIHSLCLEIRDRFSYLQDVYREAKHVSPNGLQQMPAVARQATWKRHTCWTNASRGAIHKSSVDPRLLNRLCSVSPLRRGSLCDVC